MAADAFSSHITVLWLKPEIEVVSRDRAEDYAAAARKGAPQARQVADRFHLAQNLTDIVEEILARCRAEIRKHRSHQLPPAQRNKKEVAWKRHRRFPIGTRLQTPMREVFTVLATRNDLIAISNSSNCVKRD